MRINYNTQAMRANNSLNRSDNLVSKSIERLSSGLKVNAAKDNPSGYAIGKRMNMQIEGLSQATQSANDGISIISTADGAMSEIQEMLQRLNELSIKAANGSLTDQDREMIQEEVSQLKEEINRIAKQTEFNGQAILDGSFDLRGYTNQEAIKVATYADEVPAGKYYINTLAIVMDAEGKPDLDASTAASAFDKTGAGDGEQAFPDDVKISKIDGNRVTLTGGQDFEMTLILNDWDKTSAYSATALSVDATGFGAMKMQIGANEGQTLAIRIPKMTLDSMGIQDIDVSTKEGANDAINRVKDALSYCSSARSRLGAYQNRLEHTVSSLDVTTENMTSAYSGIMDVDMAEEMTEYTTQQVITQAATSILAQANDRPSQVLQLLQ